jgi:lysophospholipase L1-like esterase
MKHLFAKLSMTLALSLAATPAPVTAQSVRLQPQEAAQLYRQISDLMEATGIAVPELARAGAPLVENVRQAAKALAVGHTREHTAVLEKLLANARIYLQISDAVPKPQPFAEDVRRQLTTLRTSIDRVATHFRALLEHNENQIRGGDRDNLARYAEDNLGLGPPAPKESRVVFLGDSITDGWPLNQYFPGKPYINRGISGQITGQMLGRMKADVLDLKPRIVVVLGGTNDLARGVKVSVIENNLAMIAALAAAHGVKPVMASILPIGDYHKSQNPDYERSRDRPPEAIRQLNDWTRRMCAEHGFVYLDYHSAMADGAGQLRAALSPDGLHPNSEGYKLMAPLAETAITKALSAKSRRKRRFGIF